MSMIIIGLVATAFALQESSAPAQTEQRVEITARGALGQVFAAAPVAQDILAIEPFDAAIWQRRLSATDLDRRMAAFERFASRLPRWPEARAWALEQARVEGAAAGELAWTCRLLLRDLERSETLRRVAATQASDPRFERTEIFLLDTMAAAPRGARRDLSIAVLDLNDGTGAHWSALQIDPILGVQAGVLTPSNALPGQFELRALAPPVPWARSTTLRFDAALEDGAPTVSAREFRGWRVVDIADDRGLDLVVHGVRVTSIESGATSGLPLPRATAGLGEVAAVAAGEWSLVPTAARPRIEVSMEYLGVFVDARNNGLVVLDVPPGSLAQRLGVGPGDRLIAIDGSDLARPDEITERLANAARNGRIALRWMRANDGATVENVYVAPHAQSQFAAEPLGPEPRGAEAAPAGSGG